MIDAETQAMAERLHLTRPPKLERTICEVLREIGRDALGRDDQATIRRVSEATEMAKSMQRKLVEYKTLADTP